MKYGDFVDYSELDAFKRLAIAEALKTREQMEALGFREVEGTRGQSAYLFEHIDTGLVLGLVIEGLGTKNVIAEDEALRREFQRTFYDVVAEDNVRMSENDLVTLGLLPFLFALHPAVENSKHLVGKNGEDLIRGTRNALEDAGCTYGPGETPGLRDVIRPGSMCLSGAMLGVLRKPEHLMVPSNLKPGMRIVFIRSSGVHSNGITLTREIAAKLPKGYLTDIGDMRTYGEALLVPTLGYAKLIRACQDNGVKMAYSANITGHGLAKIMRAPQFLTYVIEKVPPITKIFQFIMENGAVELREMYRAYNMGVGFVIFMEEDQVAKCLHTCECTGFQAFDAGYVTEGDRQVILKQYPDMKPFTKLDLI